MARGPEGCLAGGNAPPRPAAWSSTASPCFRTTASILMASSLGRLVPVSQFSTVLAAGRLPLFHGDSLGVCVAEGHLYIRGGSVWSPERVADPQAAASLAERRPAWRRTTPVPAPPAATPGPWRSSRPAAHPPAPEGQLAGGGLPPASRCLVQHRQPALPDDGQHREGEPAGALGAGHPLLHGAGGGPAAPGPWRLVGRLRGGRSPRQPGRSRVPIGDQRSPRR